MDNHCNNYDANYIGCQVCPGKLEITQTNGSVETLCRAGENAVRSLVATVSNRLPVFPIPFPAPHEA